MPLQGLVVRHATATVVGFGAGLTLGCVGWGGAQVIIPTLTSSYILGLSQISATGVSLSSLSCGVIVGAATFTNEGMSDVACAAAIAIPSIVGARFGSTLAARLHGEVHALIFNGMSVLLLPTHFLVQRFRQQELEKRPSAALVSNESSSDLESRLAVADTLKPRILMQHGTYGLASGVLSSLMGVGGLPITMSYLTLASDLPHHLIQGTAMLSVAPAVVTSAISHATTGATPLSIAAAVAAGAICGSTCGSSIAVSLSDEQLRRLYMGSLVLLGGRSFVGAIRNLRQITTRKGSIFK